MSEQNKAAVRRWIEGLNTGNLDVADEIYAPDFVMHDPGTPDRPTGPEGTKQTYKVVLAAFPDFHVTIEELIAEGDMLAVRYTATGTQEGEYMGIAPTGKKITMSALGISRWKDGKMAESWQLADTWGMMQQLGVGPAT